MRFSEYKNIIELSNSVEEALSYIEKTKNLSLLEDCLCAITGIIECLKNNKKTLKSECVVDKAYKLLQGLEKVKKDPSLLAEMNRLLSEFRMRCAIDIDRRYKLLFVADVRGKWDSMSSVYEAAKKRQDCDIDVIIQPIFRATKQQDGTTRTEVIYEDYLTPRGIAHKAYNTYKFEEEQPDITFISQPYESVTVPMFWPENIAKHSKLVYLPYFTALTLNSSISSALKSLLYLDVQKYAWRIACHSYVMENYYKCIGSQKGKNVIVSGLPKWDEVVTPNERFTQCPEEWKKKLSGKKVFIWNTHFTIKESPSCILEKGKDFLRYFQDRNDVALIWRPHPMTLVIIKTYMPERYSEYMELRQLVMDADNMVLDDNSSYLPAFYCSDALITDFSSLMEQYLFMDKPILMLVNGSVEEGRRKYYTVDGLFDFDKIPFACTLVEQKEFIEAVVRGEDTGKADRAFLRDTYFALADGKCGARFIEKILSDYIQEMDIQKEDLCLDVQEVVMVGSIKDSLPCIRYCEKNNILFSMCKEFLSSEKNEKYNIISLNELTQRQKSIVVVTAKEKIQQVYDFIVDTLNVKRERILSFWKLYKCGVPTMACDRIMQNPQTSSYDGIILGISHTEVGIIKEYLQGDFCNLAVSSQDMYFQCKTLEYCMKNYFAKIKNLKYAIIDLYDYHYFNFNTSYSKSATSYLLNGGYNLDPHDFDNNKMNKISHRKLLEHIEEEKWKGVTEIEWQLWQNIFPNIYECADYEGFCGNYDKLNERLRVVTDAEIVGYEYNRSTVTKLHKTNIVGNINAFQKLLQLLKVINPEIKIYTVIIPKYIEVEALDAAGLKMHETYFNRMVKELQIEYGFKHLDFKKISDISHHKNFYYDAAHLNYFGAIKFTDELNRIIFEENEKDM